MRARFAPDPVRRASARGGLLLAVLAGSLCSSLAGLSSAQAPAATPAGSAPSAGSAVPAPPEPTGPAIMRTARAVARELAPASAGSIVAAATLESDVAAPRGQELVARVVSLIAGSVGPEVEASKAPATLESARAAATSAAALVFVHVQIAQGELRVTADVYPVARNVWDRARNPSPGPVAHGFGAARLDAEVRSFLAPVPLVASHTLKAPLPEANVQALLCDDVDGDGALEVIAASGRSVLAGRFRGGQFEVLRKALWESFSPIAPVPWRQSLMSIALAAPGTIDLGSTDRARAARLDGRLVMREALAGFPIPMPQGSACSQRDVGVLSKTLSSCVPNGPTPTVTDVGFDFDASAASEVVRKDGTLDGVLAVRRVGDATVVLRDGRGQSVSVPNVGAQLAVADLDLDGAPELLASKNVLNPVNDALVVRTWGEGGSVQERWSVGVPQGIGAIAACPPEGEGLRAVVVATASELWLIR